MVGEQYGQPQQPQQPQYAAQQAMQPQYGAQAATPLGAYGAPGATMPPQQVMPAEVKWSGLSTGGAFKVPVIAFIGKLVDMVYDTQSTFGLRIVEKYDQVQILESPAPWPWATIDISIKYSDREESAWGRHVASAKAIGLATQAASFEQAKADLIGKIFEMRQSTESYGEDRKTQQQMQGDVWRFVRTVDIQGQAIQQPQYAAPPPVMQMPQPAAAPAPVAMAAPAPAPAPTSAFDVTLLPTDTAPVRAKKLLHGKMLNEFLGVALIDPVIKADPPFVNTIFDQSFIVGLKASNQAVQGTDGRFQIIS